VKINTVQKSVFLVNGSQQKLEFLLDQLAKYMLSTEDDLKAYPIRSPGDLWTAGPNPLAEIPLVYFG